MSKFFYRVDFKEAVFETDKPYIRGVVLLGAESKNRRRYTVECMRSAVGLYENVQAFVNHPTREEIRSEMRDVRNLAGKFTNVRYESGKIKADFQGLPDDPAAKKFMSIAENMPEIAGMSQSASGKVRREDGIEIVESILAVHSIDLVAKPATTNGFFESEKEGDSMTTREIAEMLKGSDLCGDNEILVGENRTAVGGVQESSEIVKLARSLRFKGSLSPDGAVIAELG